ncbi:MAG TPA: hypothetical protein PJ990_14105, partial [Saprospiraceae bacterium]|nr:hypothetical protein [Saprospiraceae bacterium]
MNYRLVIVAKELNIGLGVIVGFLASYGYTVENKPTSMLTSEMYSLIIKEFKNSNTKKEDTHQEDIVTQVNDDEKTIVNEVERETEIAQTTKDNYIDELNNITQNHEIIETNNDNFQINSNNTNQIKVAELILGHIQIEKDIKVLEESIGYARGSLNSREFSKWILRHPKSNNFVYVRDVHGNPIGTVSTGGDVLYSPSNTVFRDSELGLNLKKGLGKRIYKAPKGDVELAVDTYSQYTGVNDFGGDALNGLIQTEGQEKDFTFSSLYKKLEELKQLERRHDELEALILEKEEDFTEDAKKLIEELAQNEAEISELKSRITKYIAQEVALRDNPHLDDYQEDIKRSKVFDGPLIING